MKEIKGLNVLRAYAVILVIIDHWGFYFPMNTVAGFWQRLLVPSGISAVNIFFVLSGFLITSILFNAVNQKDISRSAIIKNFIARRALRIFPVYYLALAILLVINYPTIREHFWSYLFYVSNIMMYNQNTWNQFGHTWSLSVEEQFYIIWPLLIVFIAPRKRNIFFYCVIGIGIISTFYVVKIAHGFNPILMPNCLDAFGIGGLYAYARQTGNMQNAGKAIKILFPIALAVYIFWKIAPYIGQIEHLNFLARTVESIISVGLIHFIINNKSAWINKYVFENKPLNYIGIISYGVYLYHYPLGFIFDDALGKYFDNSAMGICIASSLKGILLLLICHMSYFYFEKKILKYKHLFEYKPKN